MLSYMAIRPQSGTTLVGRARIAIPPRGPSNADAHAPPPRPAPLHILILDNTPGDAELAVATLEQAGHICQWERVDTREAFVARLGEAKYDLILADYSLPGINGMTALRLLCEHQADIPFIIVSGVLGEERAIDAVKAGATDYVLKTRLARLGDVVRRALQEKEEQRQRRDAQDALRRSEERFRAVAHATHDAVWDWDLVSDTLELTDRMQDLFGYTTEQIQPRMDWWDAHIHPDDRETVLAGIHSVVDGGGRLWSAEYRFRRGDGSFAHVFDRGQVIRDGSGRPVRMIGAMMDITARKQAEEEIRGLNESLERRVRERTAQLEVANAELETFSYSVSHDLRAPLRAIEGFTRILLEDHADRLDQQGMHYLERVGAASQRMGLLITDLLALSRVSHHDLHRVSVDLSALARSIAADLRQQQPNRNVTFVIADGLQTDGDAELLRVLLDNLLGNAWKYTSKHAAARIELGTMSRENTCVYFVRDDGAGFDMRNAAKLFMPFQRLHPPTEFEGSGIGLATVQRIVHLHGGHVWAESQEARGDDGLLYAGTVTGRLPDHLIAESDPGRHQRRARRRHGSKDGDSTRVILRAYYSELMALPSPLYKEDYGRRVAPCPRAARLLSAPRGSAVGTHAQEDGSMRHGTHRMAVMILIGALF